MRKFNSPTVIVLWPKASPVVTSIGSKFQERFAFESDPTGMPIELMGATSARVSEGVVRSLADPKIRRLAWHDPLEEQDMLLIASSSNTSTIQEIRDLLNLACPVKTNNVVTFSSQVDERLESGFRITVAVARERDLSELNPNVDLFRGKKIEGPAGVMLAIASELDQAAFCIVIEYASSTEFISPAAAKSALLAFSRVTSIELRRGQMSEQAIRMHKHMKEVAAKINAEYQEKQANSFSNQDKDSFCEAARSIEDELRRNENIEWIEQLFHEIGVGKNHANHDQRIYLKSELDQLGLYEDFENRFLDLFSDKSSQTSAAEDAPWPQLRTNLRAQRGINRD